MEIEAVILAGGNSSRMGSDKGLIQVNGKSMTKHLVEALQSFVKTLWISTSNKNYIQFGVPIITDEYEGIGPLGGLHSILNKSLCKHVIVVSVDAPFVSKYCFSKLLESVQDSTVLISKCEGSSYPLIGIYPVSSLTKLEEYIESGKRSVFGFLETQKVIEIEFSEKHKDCFLNINTPEDLAEIDR